MKELIPLLIDPSKEDSVRLRIIWTKYLTTLTKDVNQVIGFDSMFKWETINPSLFHWAYPLYQAGAQLTITEWNILGDRSVSDPPPCFGSRMKV